jgi:hypothetical protein
MAMVVEFGYGEVSLLDDSGVLAWIACPLYT